MSSSAITSEDPMAPTATTVAPRPADSSFWVPPEPSFFQRRMAGEQNKIFWALLMFHLAGLLISGVMYGAGYGIFPVYLSEIPLDVAEHGELNWDKAWYSLRRDSNNDLLAEMIADQSTQSSSALPVQLIYDASANCLTPSNLASMKAFEDQISGLGALSSFCLKYNATACAEPDSILRFFDGTYEHLNVIDSGSNNVFRPDPSFSRITQILSVAYDADGRSDDPILIAAGQPNLRGILDYNIGKDYNSLTYTTGYCRTMIHFGLPLSGYRNAEDRVSEQERLIEDFQTNNLLDYLDSHNLVGDMDVFYESRAIKEEETDSQRVKDMYLMIGSLLFMFFYLAIHTWSVFLPFFIFLGAFCSYLWANLLYRVICNFHYFGQPQVLSSYIICCSALVDAFVYLSCWKLSVLYVSAPGNIADRLAFCSAKHTKLISLASFVIMVSYFVQASSHLLVVTCFVTFAGILVFVEMINSLVFLPCVIVFWETHVKPKKVCPAGCSNSTSVELGSDGSSLAAAPTKGFLHRFLTGRFWTNFVSHSLIRWLVVAAFIVLTVAFLIAAIVLLQVGDKKPIALRGPSNLKEFSTRQRDHFGMSKEDNAVTLYMIFGLLDQDFSSCARTDFECLGTPIYNDAFDLSSGAIQEEITSFCEDLFNIDSLNQSYLFLRRSVSNQLEIQCFLTSQKQYFQDNSIPFPFTYPDMQALMLPNPGLYNSTVYSATEFFPPNPKSSYYRQFEVGLTHWLSSNGASTPSEDFNIYHELVGGFADKTLRRNSQTGKLEYAGDFGGFFRYAAVKVNLTLDFEDIKVSDGLQVMQRWVDYMDSINAHLPRAVGQVHLATPDKNEWNWLFVRDGLLSNLLKNLLLSFFVSFALVLLISCNWALTLMTFIMVAFVCVLYLGICGIIGWDLEVIQSLTFTIIMPVAIIFLLPLQSTYGSSRKKTRLGRCLDTLNHIGVPLLNSGLCISGASLFLFGARQEYFFQFGVTLFCIAVLSLFYGFCFYLTLLGICGPEKEEGVFLWYSLCRGGRKSQINVSSESSKNLIISPHVHSSTDV